MAKPKAVVSATPMQVLEAAPEQKGHVELPVTTGIGDHSIAVQSASAPAATSKHKCCGVHAARNAFSGLYPCIACGKAATE